MKVGRLIGHACCLALRPSASVSIQSDAASSRPAPGFRILKAIMGVAACVLFGVWNVAAQGEQVFKGQVCLGSDGPTAAAGPCTATRAKRGAKYVLADVENKTVYQLEGRKKPISFVGRNVVVVGTLDQSSGTIHIDDIFRALSPKLAQAKSIYILCDACPRGMAVAWRTAFEELSSWGKYDITPDPKKADLIFWFSANRYLGDYVTRDGPDKRPVNVDITYMNVIDPHTGQSLWGDYKQWGSLFVPKATKDLINEFKEELNLEEDAGKK
jgi:hypothetical protein